MSCIIGCSLHCALFGAAALCIEFARIGDARARGDVEKAKPVPADEAARVVAAFWSARQDLHTGVCRVRWHYVFPPHIDETAHYTVAFDFDRDLLRYDKREEERNRRIQEVRRPDERLLTVSGSHVVSRKPPGEEIAVGGAIPIDPRVIGLENIPGFMLGATWRSVREVQSKFGDPTASQEDGGVFRVNWEFTEPLTVKVKDGPPINVVQRFHTTLWIDTIRGFTPVRQVYQFSIDGQKQTRQTSPHLTETTWAPKGGTYVPIECVMHGEENMREGKLTFDWLSVNEPVDEKLFTVAGLQVDPNTLVVNHKLGPKIIEKKINQSNGDNDTPSQIDDATTNRWRWIATVTSLVVIAVGLLALRFRRREKRQ